MLASPATTVTLSLELSVARMRELLLLEIGHELAEHFEDLDLEGRDLEAPMDCSVEATATRIADFATGLLGIHRGQNPDVFEADVLDHFEEMLRGAIARGYRSALSTMAVIGIEAQTWPLAEAMVAQVGERLDAFFAGQRGAWPLARSA